MRLALLFDTVVLLAELVDLARQVRHQQVGALPLAVGLQTLLTAAAAGEAAGEEVERLWDGRPAR